MVLMMTTALLLGGCGQNAGDEPDTPPQPGEKAIAFSGALSEGGSVTRAGEPTLLKDLYQSFYVWAYKKPSADSYEAVMKYYTVNWHDNSAGTTTTNSNGWEYVNQQGYDGMEQSIKYWDFSAKAYRFFATTASNRGTVITADDETFFRLSFDTDATKAETCPYYSQLWFSDNQSGRPSYGEPVRLVFLQPISRVRFKFIFEDENEAPTTDLTDKRFFPSDGGSIKTNGIVHVNYPLLNGITETLVVADDAEGIGAFTQDYYESVRTDVGTGKVVSPYYDADATAVGKEYKVLPTPTGQSAYKLQVSVNGEQKTVVVSDKYMTWQPGYLYTYVFKIHVDGGVSIASVQSAFTPWEVDEKPHTVYNW